ncbi:hypothetical protein WG66_009531 [Moniliophthora roreri]
MAKEH